MPRRCEGLFVSLFNVKSTFVGHFLPNASIEKNSRGTFLTYSWEDKGVHTFLKDICLKVNIISRLKFELAY